MSAVAGERASVGVRKTGEDEGGRLVLWRYWPAMSAAAEERFTQLPVEA